jgi:hypothetical protein
MLQSATCRGQALEWLSEETMRLIKPSVCLAAALQASFAWSQGAAPSQAVAPPKAAQAGAQPVAVSPDMPNTTYRSAFTDYRRFDVEEPLKNWRRANDEVRDAGGHVGLMKGPEGKAMDHGGHGAKPKEPGK